MIKFTDTALLAYTKLRARKIRTIITVLLASLLFGVLITASLVITGAFHSVAEFRNDGLTSRYIVSVYSTPPDQTAFQTMMRDPGLIAQAKTRYKALIANKTAEAKRLGLAYEQSSDQLPYTIDADGHTERLAFNDPNGIVTGVLKDKFSSDPAFDDTKLASLAEQYGATKLFTDGNYSVLNSSQLISLKSGKEVFYDQTDEAETSAKYVVPLVDPTRMVLASPNTTDPFLLPNNAGWQPDGKSLPIILPQNIVERALGMQKLPATSSATEKLDRIKTVRTHAENLTIQACYRNSVSVARIQQAIQQQKEIAANKGNKDYQKPPLIYGLPDPAKCENPLIISDARSQDQKRQDTNQAIFDQEFGKATNPISYFVSFKVVGISPAEMEIKNGAPDAPANQIRNASDVASFLLQTSGIGQAVPQQLYNQLPNKAAYADLFTYHPLYLFGNEDNKQRYVEFASAKAAQKFIDEQSCTVQYDNTCKPLGRQYQAGLAFSNSSALDDMQSIANQWFTYAMIGIMTLAAIIMWITIGRAIADGRHETAVFRAIGFKRIDIAAVYIFYTVFLSTLVALLAGILGFIGAYVVDQQLAPTLTAQAQYAFGGLDLAKKIGLIGFDNRQLLIVFVACFVTGLFSMIIPLLGNVRRNPLRDMREE